MKNSFPEIKDKIRVVEDFPIKGISFKDITPLLADIQSYRATLDTLTNFYKDKGITKVCGIDSRGFIFGSALSDRINAGFIPIRKAGKLPYTTKKIEYSLEYGTDSLEIHTDAICEDDIVLIHDDLLATGGTVNAAIELVKKFNPKKIYVSFIIELSFLQGRSKIKSANNEDIHSILEYTE